MRRKKRNRRKRPARAAPVERVDLRKPLTSSVVLVAGLFGSYVLAQALDGPIAAVDVDAPFQRVARPQVEATLRTSLRGGFLSVDLAQVRAALESLPWIDRVAVRRHWPNRLVVEITEHVAAARWGEAGLLNTRGELFVTEAHHPPPELPQLSGPPGSESRVARRYLELRGQLLEAGFNLDAVTLDERGAWQLKLASGMEVRLGREAVDERARRFVEVVVPMLVSRLARVAYVDMRYANGFAVGWAISPTARPAEHEDREPNA